MSNSTMNPLNNSGSNLGNTSCTEVQSQGLIKSVSSFVNNLLLGLFNSKGKQELFKLVNLLGPSTFALKNDEKVVFFTKQGFEFDGPVNSRLKLTDKERLELGLPNSDDTKIEALVSLTPKERKALGVEDDYQEFLALLRKKIK